VGTAAAMVVTVLVIVAVIVAVMFDSGATV
jgi:hypothetical protein